MARKKSEGTNRTLQKKTKVEEMGKQWYPEQKKREGNNNTGGPPVGPFPQVVDGPGRGKTGRKQGQTEGQKEEPTRKNMIPRGCKGWGAKRIGGGQLRKIGVGKTLGE